MSDRKKSLTLTEELATSAPEQRNWKGICIALLVIAVICSLVVTAVILVYPAQQDFRNHPRIRLAEVLNKKFTPRRINATWISTHEFVYRDMHGSLMIFNAQKNTSQVLAPNNTFRQHKADDYRVSSDRKFLLLICDKKKIYSHTFKAKYLIYNITSQNAKELTPKERERGRLQYARWGTTGNQLIYVHKNNIYYAASVEQVLNKFEEQITYNGQIGVYFNGVPDWLYEEEVFKRSNTVWWSPSGIYLCYASINDSKVKSMVYPRYGSFIDPENLYPTLEALRYPKSGTNNPVIKLYVVDLRMGRKRPIYVTPPDTIRQFENYITSVSWIDDRRLSVTWVNRKQNYSVVAECTPNGWICFSTTEHMAFPGGKNGKSWVEMFDAPIHDPDYRQYLKLPLYNSRSGFYTHIAKITFRDRKRRFITRGEYEVTKILSFDRENNKLFYVANQPGKAGERHIYSVVDQLFATYHQPHCITCHLGSDCLYNDAIFSSDGKFYILECLGPNVPYSALYKTDDNNTLVRILDRNDEVRKLVASRAMPQNLTFLVPLNSKFKAEVRLFVPPGFRETNSKKYPMVLQAYGGPGTQGVTEKFVVDWAMYLASQRQFIYAYIDARGAGYRGDRFVQEIHRKIGTIDVEDQMVVARYLSRNLHFIDEEYIAIWGWSYGGYVTTMSMTAHRDDVFKCGIAVAPVTSWLYYDSIFTERYMQTFKENKEGYLRADSLSRAKNLRNRKFFLIHGSADDDVHFQQSMMLAMALNKQGVMYRSQFYPDEGHDLIGVQEHLYRSMEGFLDECFDQTELGFYRS
ncbi:Uncharacterised protein g4646 [Pycnogonum litorale]